MMTGSYFVLVTSRALVKGQDRKEIFSRGELGQPARQ